MSKINRLVFFLLCICLAKLYLCVQRPAQAQNLRDSLVESKSDIVVKVLSVDVLVSYFMYFLALSFAIA